MESLDGVRRSGVLLHPTSLPGRFGTGTIGPDARAFVGWMERAGQSLWQMLPLTPVDGFGCPYASPSAFASNPLLISLVDLVDEGLLDADDPALAPLAEASERQPEFIDFDLLFENKLPAVRRAAARSLERGDLTAPFAQFVRDNSGWVHGWAEWEAARSPGTSVEVERAVQHLFDRQWQRLRATARDAGVALIGDLPIFVSGNSAEVDDHPELFCVGDDGRPEVVAGVPPDAFSPTGQLWGNPLYAWEAHASTSYAWWKARVRALLRLVDYVRVDHFRGFAACWEVAADAVDATGGRWVPGPGRDLFDALCEDLGGLPFIAEDLGVITDDVKELRDSLRLPGMKILQFAFDGDPDHPYLPHNHGPRCVVYTGTHDNETTRGWYGTTDERSRDVYRRYTARDGSDPAGDLVRLAMGSVADTCITPMQDLLRLGGGARMNCPGSVGSQNWTWRLRPGQPTGGDADALAATTRTFGRAPKRGSR